MTARYLIPLPTHADVALLASFPQTDGTIRLYLRRGKYDYQRVVTERGYRAVWAEVVENELWRFSAAAEGGQA